jgi:DNA-directed RNA polymerase specialized sigma24 family protein
MAAFFTSKLKAAKVITRRWIVSEASARSGMSESAVKVAVHRGLKALALRFGRGGAHEYR